MVGKTWYELKMKILDISIQTVSYAVSVSQILVWANHNDSRSVYAANVHMLMEAHDHTDFRQMVNEADLVTPDGMPLVWALRLKGVKGQERVYGPTLMLEVLRAAEKEQIPVGFLGSTDEILTKLSENMLAAFPGLKIAICKSLPFRPLTANEDSSLCESIAVSRARILFIALGCPKQECWIAAHKGKIKAVMIGVGAAFAFHAGEVRQAPIWMQKAGLEWLFRFSQEPERLWRRYWINNPRFVVLVGRELIRERLLHFTRTGGD
jgi:N-acetylglucosaminyldiphosphoundecaprenol N-acetyl-beta-D-mannosaminyltransferase